MSPSPSHRRAFTLVELLVVIGIIAVLISILLPTLSRAQASAKLVACKSNLRQLLQAHTMYANEFADAKPPLWQKRTLTTQVDHVSPDVKWNGKTVGQGILVERRLVTLDVLMCPASEMVEDVGLDRKGWEDPTLVRSGSSYVYFYRPNDPSVTSATFCRGVRYNDQWRAGHRAMIMDICADEGHPYAGEYAGKAWVAHRRMNRVNVGYGDGSVQSLVADEAKLLYPGGVLEELAWFQTASAKY